MVERRHEDTGMRREQLRDAVAIGSSLVSCACVFWTVMELQRGAGTAVAVPFLLGTAAWLLAMLLVPAESS